MNDTEINAELSRLTGAAANYVEDPQAVAQAERFVHNGYGLYLFFLQHVQPHPVFADTRQRATALVHCLRINPPQDDEGASLHASGEFYRAELSKWRKNNGTQP